MIQGSWSNQYSAHSASNSTTLTSRFNCEEVIDQNLIANISKSTAHSVVRILAFTQSVLFIGFLFFLCSNAGAETPPANRHTHTLEVSTYEPTKTRDPFAQIGVRNTTQKVLPTTSLSFHLQGILYDPLKPSAIVNDRLINLGEKIAIVSRNSEVEVTAVDITPNRVLLEVQGQRIELTISDGQQQKKEKEKQK